MKAPLSVLLALLALLFCANAQAQFSQPPPPTKKPPVCGQRQAGGGSSGGTSLCQTDPLATTTTLQCGSYQGYLSCEAKTLAYNGTEWVLVDPSFVTHYWAYTVDGQDDYLSPSGSNTITIHCGYSLTGHVRITAGGNTLIAPYECMPSTWN
jgi:hypothetical protein